MDVPAVRNLADQLDAQANRVSHVVGLVDGVVAVLAEVWRGDSMHVFSDSWHASHRPNATAVFQDLHGWVTRLRAQADEQERVSGGTGSGAGDRWGGIGGRFHNDLQIAGYRKMPDGSFVPLFPWLFSAGGALGGFGKVVGANHKIAEWSKAFRASPRFSSWGSGLRTVLQKEGHGIGHVFRSTHLSPRAVANIHDATKWVKGAGKVASVASTVVDGGEAVYDLAHHDGYGAFDKGTDAGADIAQRFGPVGFLAGANVKIWKDVAGLAATQHARDWTDWGWVTHTSLNDWGSILGNTARDTGKELASHLWKDLF
jgi:uncharacterized protein YukE